MADTVRVLHVDDDREFAELTAEFLRREDDRFDIETETSVSAGLDCLADGGFDCVVSDYRMPGMDGLAFIDAVRAERPNLPFILFTGEGSEDIASEAISRGVTDYLQKGTDTERYALLANRITNAVEQFRARRRAAEQRRISTVVREVNEALVHARTAEEVDERVCEVLADADPYRLAWIGDVDPETNRIEPRTAAGIGTSYPDEITVTADDTPTGRGPGGTAVREGRVAVSQDVSEDDSFAP
jgi:CheY-like chemotaxis protein